MAQIGMVLRGDIRYDGRVRKEITTLVRAGHNVELIVSDFHRDGSGGEDLGAKIHFVPTTLGSSPARNFVEQVVFNRRAAKILHALRPSHIHCHDLSSLLAGVWAKKKINATLVFDAHELMPESFCGVRKKVWNIVEGWCIKDCDYIIMPEKNRIAYFKRKYTNIPEPLLVQNFPRKSEIPADKCDLFRDIYPVARDQKIVLYTGLIAALRHIEELIDSMNVCGEEFILIILGEAFKGYDEILRGRINELGLTDRIFLHEAVPHAEILRYMASCDVGIALYRNTDVNNYYCASNKVYEYIALGKPVVTNNYPGLVETVERFGQGVCVAEVCPESLAEAYVHACDPCLVTPGTKTFYWEDEEDAIIQLYDKEEYGKHPG